jgi:NAD(P)H dehydrogenase (quinone)
MHVYIIFAHPSKSSFTYKVLKSFINGLQEAGHEYETGDLYEMNFKSGLDLAEYNRDVSLNPEASLAGDIAAEQEKIDRADALTFIYPLWWSDCPAILKGWFDRVWSYGYAYCYDEQSDHVTSKINIKKALVICSAGHTEQHLEETGITGAMRSIMLNDRLLGVGIGKAHMEILGGQVLNDTALREKNLQRAFLLGKHFDDV